MRNSSNKSHSIFTKVKSFFGGSSGNGNEGNAKDDGNNNENNKAVSENAGGAQYMNEFNAPSSPKPETRDADSPKIKTDIVRSGSIDGGAAGKKGPKHNYNAITLGRPKQLSPYAADTLKGKDKEHIPPTSPPLSAGDEGPAERKWHQRYVSQKQHQQEEDEKDEAESSKDGGTKKKGPQIVMDVTKWKVLERGEKLASGNALASSGNNNKSLSGGLDKEGVMEKIMTMRRRAQTTEIHKNDLILPVDELTLSKQDIRRQEIIYEFIITEKDYVGDLRVLVNVSPVSCAYAFGCNNRLI